MLRYLMLHYVNIALFYNALVDVALLFIAIVAVNNCFRDIFNNVSNKITCNESERLTH